MAGVKYQIFVSSTYEDLKHERDLVVKAILEMGHIPVGMEMFSAGDEDQWNVIARHIETSDYYVVIVAQRYGSTDGTGRSFTEKEYDFATACGIPVIGFLLSDTASWPVERIESDPAKRDALRLFQAKVKTRYVGFWSSADDLYGKVSVALMKQMSVRPRTGWVRADQVASPEVSAELARLSRENAELRRQVQTAPAAGTSDSVSAAWRDYFLFAGRISNTRSRGPADSRTRQAEMAAALSRLDLDVIGTASEQYIDEAAELGYSAVSGANVDGKLTDLRRRVAKTLRGVTA